MFYWLFCLTSCTICYCERFYMPWRTLTCSIKGQSLVHRILPIQWTCTDWLYYALWPFACVFISKFMWARTLQCTPWYINILEDTSLIKDKKVILNHSKIMMNLLPFFCNFYGHHAIRCHVNYSVYTRPPTLGKHLES